MAGDDDDKANATNAEKPATAKQVEELSNNLAAMKTYIPTFWPDNAEAWFIGAETQFDLAGITREKTKFQKIVSVLPEDVAVQVLDITSKDFMAGDYQKLKLTILQIFKKTRTARFNELFATVDIRNMKPTAILSRLRNLINSSDPEEKFSFSDRDLKDFFIRALPAHTQGYIRAIVKDFDIETLAKKADLYSEEFEHLSSTSSVAAVAASSEYLTQSAFREEFRLLRAEIAAIRKQGKPSSNKESGKSQAKSSYRDRSPTPAPANRTGNICYYHRKFGDKAKKCEKGCARAHSGN